MPEPVSAKPVPKLRAKSATKASGRPRPKTIHVDQDADVNTALQQSRGPRGSISNISGKAIWLFKKLNGNLLSLDFGSILILYSCMLFFIHLI